MLLMLFPMLKGIFSTPSANKKASAKERPPAFSLTTWFNGEFQDSEERYLKKYWIFRDYLTKLHNQVDLVFFNKINVRGFQMGKDRYIFAQEYLDSYLGKDYVGEDSVRTILTRLKVVQDTLKKKNIDVVVVYAPGKATYFSELVPDKYGKPGKVNLTDFLSISKELGLNYIDMSAWFLDMKKTTQYPLFPQYGHHWSYYGECLAADSLIKYISKLRNTQLPAWGWSDIQLKDTLLVRDADIMAKMNLLTAMKTFPMAYPRLRIAQKSPINNTNVLSISDSYYRGFQYLGVMEYVFGHGTYWYYYNKVWSGQENGTREVWEFDLKKEIEKSQVILLLAADANLQNIGFGFINDAYLLYTNPDLYYSQKKEKDKLNVFRKQIRGDESVLDEIKKSADKRNITVDSAITEEALSRKLKFESGK